MEQKEKIENPEWVRIVESLIPSARQVVGNACAQAISSLAFIFEVSSTLYDAVIHQVILEIAEVTDSDD